MEDLIV